ncbi:hypothetical protein UY3_07945 [Chelonia mydas]|uniref:Uncharacterized protein n=1 Tax=Chelonia mydas TaxID=8469 RepID=M7BAF4_CHEMY|nr:hypothetical protein UY3_07945 [Chelonia mydas]
MKEERPEFNSLTHKEYSSDTMTSHIDVSSAPCGVSYYALVRYVPLTLFTPAALSKGQHDYSPESAVKRELAAQRTFEGAE